MLLYGRIAWRKTPAGSKPSNRKLEMSNETRGPGRPANFPGQKVESFVAKLPTETGEMVREFAKSREVPIGVALDTLIRRAVKASDRKRSPK